MILKIKLNVENKKGLYMTYFLEKAIRESDKMKKQSALNCAKSIAVKLKRFDQTRLFFTMLFGQATILSSLFTALSFMFEEEDWMIFDRVPFFKRILIELSSISPKWYLEALIIIAFAFMTPCILGWIAALPVKLLPVKTNPIHPEASDYAKKIYDKVYEIKIVVEKNEVGGAALVMFLSSVIYAIVCAVVLIYSGVYKEGKFVFDNLFGSLIGAVFLMVLVGGIMYGLNFVLYLLACTLTHNFKNGKETLNRACTLFEREWLNKDEAEKQRRQREYADEVKKKQLEERRQREEKKKQDKLKAEAAVWAYQNNYTPDIFVSNSSSLTENDHDDLDSLTEAMGFETDVSDM